MKDDYVRAMGAGVGAGMATVGAGLLWGWPAGLLAFGVVLWRGYR